MFSKDISKQIILLPLISIIVVSLFLTGITIFTLNKAFLKQEQEITTRFMRELKEKTKEKVNLAYVIVDALYKQNLKRYKNVKKAKEETIKEFPLFFDNFRWGKKGYIFMFSTKEKGVTVYHINHKFMKVNRWNLVRHGQKIFQIIYYGAIKHPEGTYVRYIAYNPDGKPLDKISYVKVYKPLDILIGSGVYLNYLDKELLQEKEKFHNLLVEVITKIVIFSLLFIAILGVIVYFFARNLKHIFLEYEAYLKEEKEKFKKKAYVDNLTNLYNRLGLKDRFNDIKYKYDKLALLFIDLDHFKEINDSLGHEVGDELLKVIATRLRKSVKARDIVSRFGGDEFIILFSYNNEKDIEKVANRILISLRYPVIVDDEELYVSASIGIALYPQDAKDYEEVIRYADAAMYKAKTSGKDRFHFFDKTIAEELSQKLHLKQAIHKALENNEFEVYFQPQIDRNNKLYGCEALIRWNHKGKVISPFYFIPIAIEMGIIDKIDLWVIQESIKTHLKWQEKGFYPVISCNVTVFQLEKGKFSKNLENLLNKYNFNPKYLNIEVTEEGLMKNPEMSIKILKEVAELGVKINIDDFGTGYSSLAYLKKLPISKIKIDREFIKDIPNDKDDEVITKTIITLAKNLNLQTVAEGVETEEQLDFCFSNGCDYIQGYFYSPPIKASEFEEKFLKDKNDSN